MLLILYNVVLYIILLPERVGSCCLTKHGKLILIHHFLINIYYIINLS